MKDKERGILISGSGIGFSCLGHVPHGKIILIEDDDHIGNHIRNVAPELPIIQVTTSSFEPMNKIMNEVEIKTLSFQKADGKESRRERRKRERKAKKK